VGDAGQKEVAADNERRLFGLNSVPVPLSIGGQILTDSLDGEDLGVARLRTINENRDRTAATDNS